MRVSARRHKHRKGWAVRIWFKRSFLDVNYFAEYDPHYWDKRS